MGRRPSSMDMTMEQKEHFHLNFRYMWDKLGTSYYYVVGPHASEYNDDRKNGINDDLRVLPSYSVCASCYSGNPDYWPSKDAVRRIVAFYNQWIKPEITVADFLNEDLSASNDQRYRPGSMCDWRFEGVYRGFYYSQVAEKMAGAYLIIHKSTDEHLSGRMKAVLITGFYSDEAMDNPAFREKVLNAQNPGYSAFCDYLCTLDERASRQDYYEGEVEMNEDCIMIMFRKQEKDFGRIAMMINISAFPYNEKLKRPCIGCLAYMMSTESSGVFPAFYTIGFGRDKGYTLSMDDPGFVSLLKVPGKPFFLRLRPVDDKRWVNYIRTLEIKKDEGITVG